MHPNVSQYRGYWKPTFGSNQSEKVSVDDQLAPYGASVSSLLNITANCYAYEDTFHSLQDMTRNCDYSWGWVQWLCEKKIYYEKKPSTEHIIVRPLKEYPVPKEEDLIQQKKSLAADMHDDINDSELQEYHHEISKSRKDFIRLTSIASPNRTRRRTHKSSHPSDDEKSESRSSSDSWNWGDPLEVTIDENHPLFPEIKAFYEEWERTGVPPLEQEDGHVSYDYRNI
jgi:hypothetical protein